MAKQNNKLNKANWVCAAKEILIEEGIGSINLRKLAQSLQVTTGAFYWQYKNLGELYAAIRSDWSSTNTAPFTMVFEDKNKTPKQQYLAYVRVLISEKDYDPRYDNAMRDWAAISKNTADLVRKIDNIRITQLKNLYMNMGYDAERAKLRARVTYFHQSGYIAMGYKESLEERLKNIPFYAEILTGHDILPSGFDPQSLKELLGIE